ncbi:hypothetical protein FSP39_010370 [Pinctada imbricata]|uniref:ADP-ribosylhydrolase ARH3 n=1 Tax=Pinctada imbricata TaxID=66713 RepID=A0AA89C125_PINIB|nr:hypothetical protein FSP39_010370 [Pinctada imbricata]
MTSLSLLSRFKGALVGAVLGDCIGAYFEFEWAPSIEKEKIVNLVNKIEAESKKDKKKKVWEFTDDTAMTRSVARSLIAHPDFSSVDMAKKFTEEYHKEPDRGYGNAVITIFEKLKASDYKDIYKPASEQFDGQGSYGNGGAMRISPAPLLAQREEDNDKITKIELTDKITRLTHTHRDAINGAVMQSLAINLALKCHEEVDIDNFVDTLKSDMAKVEEKSRSKLPKPDTEDGAEVEEFPYCKVLETVREYAKQEQKPDMKDINDNLGTEISALKSVPAALFSFLRASKYGDDFKDRNPFERTMMLSISLGGDTDTIATMAGAIAGACYGINVIPESWQTCCEGVSDAIEFAEELHKLQGK